MNISISIHKIVNDCFQWPTAILRREVGHFKLQMGKPGSKSEKANASEAPKPKEEKKNKGPMHLSKGAKKAKNIKANHGGKTDRKPLV